MDGWIHVHFPLYTVSLPYMATIPLPVTQMQHPIILAMENNKTVFISPDTLFLVKTNNNYTII